jgi:hypothetical protein
MTLGIQLNSGRTFWICDSSACKFLTKTQKLHFGTPWKVIKISDCNDETMEVITMFLENYFKIPLLITPKMYTNGALVLPQWALDLRVILSQNVYLALQFLIHSETFALPPMQCYAAWCCSSFFALS